MSTVRQYELIYITPPETTDEALAELQQAVAGIVEKFGGTIVNTEPWGRRRLAYEIGGFREGVYVLHLIQAPGELTAELDRRLRVLDIVLRHLIVRVDEAHAVADRALSRRKATMARRRAKRGLPPEPTESERRQHRGDDDDEDGGMGGRDGRDAREPREPRESREARESREQGGTNGR
jgi:small subunit ribosomal protein S6